MYVCVAISTSTNVVVVHVHTVVSRKWKRVLVSCVDVKVQGGIKNFNICISCKNLFNVYGESTASVLLRVTL